MMTTWTQAVVAWFLSLSGDGRSLNRRREADDEAKDKGDVASGDVTATSIPRSVAPFIIERCTGLNCGHDCPPIA